MATIDCAGVRLLLLACVSSLSFCTTELSACVVQACSARYCQRSCVIADMIAHRASGICADRDVYEHNLISHFEELVSNQELATDEELVSGEESDLYSL